MQKSVNWIGVSLAAAIGIGALFFGSANETPISVGFDGSPVAPNSYAIANWPDVDGAATQAEPDPNRIYTAIVLDASGSMGRDMRAARQAVQVAVASMHADDWVAVIALNAGVIAQFAPVKDAQADLVSRLERVSSTGSTPLTQAIQAARAELEQQAAETGGFGTFRILVTTDGAADNREALANEIVDLAQRTPIQITTIGVGIGNRHVMNREDIGTFVPTHDVDDLANALRSAVAEQTGFTAIKSFGE